MLQFTKMQGLGNDYIYFDCTKEELREPEALSVRLSDRHFGVGADGIVLILPSHAADFRMRMFNADGSEGKMCGNASRCIAKYVYERGLTDKTTVTLETLSGIKTLFLTVQDGVVERVRVNMGVPELLSVPGESRKAVNLPIQVGTQAYRFTGVSMGNPHCVVFTEDVNRVPLREIGPLFECHPFFPERVNTEFVQRKSETELSMRVWERGSGETLACGTGACASVVAAVHNGFCPADTDIAVHLLGGTLSVRWTNEGVLMTGPAAFSFDGVIHENSENADRKTDSAKTGKVAEECF